MGKVRRPKWQGRAGGVLALIAVAAAAACEPPPEEASDPRPPATPAPTEPVSFQAPVGLPGELLVVEGILRFRACGQGDAQPVDDRTGSDARGAIEELGYGEDRVLAVVVLDGGQLLELRHAVPEAAGCESLLSGDDLQAWGNEPFWNARISGDRLVWRTPDDPEGTSWEEGGWDRPAERAWRFEARRGGVDGVEYLTLELVEERCRDTMAGSYYPFTARVSLDGRTLHGCALEGTGAVPDP